MSREEANPRRRTAEEAARLVAEYETGDLTKRDFCRKHGLAVSTLDAYRSGRRLRWPAQTQAARWVAVEVQGAQAMQPEPAGSGLVVVLSRGRRIEVGRGFDAAALRELLGVLERD